MKTFVINQFTGRTRDRQNYDVVDVQRIFERLHGDVTKFLSDVEKSLKPGGLLRLTVADHDAAHNVLARNGDQFKAILFGEGWESESCHIVRYSEEEIIKAVEAQNFDFVEKFTPNVGYPAWGFVFRSFTHPEARHYAFEKTGVVLQDKWVVAELGPGAYPLDRANIIIDHSKEILDRIADRPGTMKILADANKQLPLPDKSIDFLFASHVFEHLCDPVAAAKEISRIAKRGMIVAPGAFKEFLFLWEEKDHKWWIFPPSAPAKPIRFMKPDENFQKATGDLHTSSILCSVYRTIPEIPDPRVRTLRRWYHKNEPDLDVIVLWEDELKVEIM